MTSPGQGFSPGEPLHIASVYSLGGSGGSIFESRVSCLLRQEVPLTKSLTPLLGVTSCSRERALSKGECD
jgi:hypothetical protein